MKENRPKKVDTRSEPNTWGGQSPIKEGRWSRRIVKFTGWNCQSNADVSDSHNRSCGAKKEKNRAQLSKLDFSWLDFSTVARGLVLMRPKTLSPTLFSAFPSCTRRGASM
jgi:hypothetical protein